MKWRCALIHRWLPGHLDGELTGFRLRRLEAHLSSCAACREEAHGLQEVAALMQAHPLPEPGPDFWQDFSRELHLKLVQATPEPAPRRWFKPYYLVAAPALAVLLVWFATNLSLSPTAKVSVAQNGASEQLVYAGLDDGLWQGDDFTSWDVNAVVADLSEHDREVLLKRLRY